MSTAYGIKAIKPTDEEHVLGFASGRTGADDALFELWNGSSNANRVFRVQKDGAVQTGDGTLSLPAYSFESDKDSGWRLAAAGDMRAVIAAADVVAITATGLSITGNLAVSGNSDVGTVVTGSWTATPIASAYLGTHGHAFDDITEVNLGTPSNNDVLTYSTGTGEWSAQAPTAGGLAGLSDVTITTPVTDQVLQYDGAEWVNAALAIADITGLQTALDGKIADPGTVTDNALVRWDGTGGAAVQDSGWTLGDTDIMNAADNILLAAVLKDVQYTGVNKGTMSGAITLDLADGNYFYGTVTGNITTLTLTGAPVSGTVGFLQWEIYDAGSYTITFPASVKWAGGVEPTFTTSGWDVILLSTRDSGTTWLASMRGFDFS